MPVERRSPRRQLFAIVFSVSTLVVAGLLLASVLRSASNAKPVTVPGSKATFDVGDAKDRAATIAKDGPILFSDVSGTGQNRPIYVQHLGDSPTTGWVIIDASVPATDNCFLRWQAKAKLFATTCNNDRYPADGTGLNRYAWSIDDVGSLTVDLRKPAA